MEGASQATVQEPEVCLTAVLVAVLQAQAMSDDASFLAASEGRKSLAAQLAHLRKVRGQLSSQRVSQVILMAVTGFYRHTIGLTFGNGAIWKAPLAQAAATLRHCTRRSTHWSIFCICATASKGQCFACMSNQGRADLIQPLSFNTLIADTVAVENRVGCGLYKLYCGLCKVRCGSCPSLFRGSNLLIRFETGQGGALCRYRSLACSSARHPSLDMCRVQMCALIASCLWKA